MSSEPKKIAKIIDWLSDLEPEIIFDSYDNQTDEDALNEAKVKIIKLEHSVQNELNEILLNHYINGANQAMSRIRNILLGIVKRIDEEIKSFREISKDFQATKDLVSFKLSTRRLIVDLAIHKIEKYETMSLNDLDSDITPDYASILDNDSSKIRILYHLGFFDKLKKKNPLLSQNKIAKLLYDIGYTNKIAQSTLNRILNNDRPRSDDKTNAILSSYGIVKSND